MEIILETPVDQANIAWEQNRTYSIGSRSIAYINQVSLATVLPWLEETLGMKSTTNSYWELVNGTAITIDQTRIVLIPSHAIDTNEIRVPIEWVDIPSWAADYYLAAQVNSEDSWVKIWGYATHLQLKRQASYDRCDRTYCLNSRDLIHDMNVLWVSRELCPEAATRSEIEPLPRLSVRQANNLIATLGTPSTVFPRVAVTFQEWGAVLENDEYRQRLIELRQQR